MFDIFAHEILSSPSLVTVFILLSLLCIHTRFNKSCVWIKQELRKGLDCQEMLFPGPILPPISYWTLSKAPDLSVSLKWSCSCWFLRGLFVLRVSGFMESPSIHSRVRIPVTEGILSSTLYSTDETKVKCFNIICIIWNLSFGHSFHYSTLTVFISLY